MTALPDSQQARLSKGRVRGEKGTERTTDVMIASPNRERWDRRSDEEDNVRRFAPASSSTGGSSVRFRCARCLSASLTSAPPSSPTLQIYFILVRKYRPTSQRGQVGNSCHSVI